MQRGSGVDSASSYSLLVPVKLANKLKDWSAGNDQKNLSFLHAKELIQKKFEF